MFTQKRVETKTEKQYQDDNRGNVDYSEALVRPLKSCGELLRTELFGTGKDLTPNSQVLRKSANLMCSECDDKGTDENPLPLLSSESLWRAHAGKDGKQNRKTVVGR